MLLDTHVLLWLLGEPGRLNPDLMRRIADSNVYVAVSAASLWEIAIKYSVGKLALPGDPEKWLPERIQESRISVLSVGASHALRVAGLPMHHRDPFDRMLIAQAQVESIPVVTRDPAFAAYDVEVIPAT